MPNAEDILWFKTNFRTDITAACVGTPFDLDMLTALACQETGEVWPTLRRTGLTTEKILKLCVGDTIDDTGGRKAFPKNKNELIKSPQGSEMFELAHLALKQMAEYISGYQGVAKKADKFCHGFGLFQYDLQFFKDDPEYFLNKKYEVFSQTLGKCLHELSHALKKLKWTKNKSLSDYEMACVAITYNTGGFKASRGLKQGYKSGGKYYGEAFFDYLQLSRTIALPGEQPLLDPTASGQAILQKPSAPTATGKKYFVDTMISTLRVRSEPEISSPITKNVVSELPDGQAVQSISNQEINGFIEIETTLCGALIRGYVSTKYLKAAPRTTEIEVFNTPLGDPTVPAVYMPRKSGTQTTRANIAGAHSLNEPNQPTRKGSTPDELRLELANIISWLGVGNASHLRYKPRSGLTFCNIYAHDYCYLAGTYLPRVWWTPSAIKRLFSGEKLKPLYGATITEMRVNDLFRWLRDFGTEFGWRQTSTLDKLQMAANQGGVGIIVARRKEDGRSGHIVLVVPETDDQRAKRNSSGVVTAPLQSQAGSKNFQYGTGGANWWKAEKFAESAFWIHS